MSYNKSAQLLLFFLLLKKNKMKKVIILLFIALSINSFAQTESANNGTQTLAEELMSRESNLTIGGYAQVDYNQALESGIRNNGTLDVHRLVMLFGYKFNSKTNFVTEIEYEHVKEVYIEQAFLNYKINDFINLRAGLMLIPMGIINEYHEPTTFNGVERPNLDKYVSPTTWREIGLGLSGRFNEAAIKYQLYVVNGFNGYNGGTKLNGSKAFRSGRQKGAESYISSPNFAARVDYYGISGLKLGLSSYLGKTQSDLYDGIDESNSDDVAKADSSLVGISMLGADLRFNKKGFQFRGQLNYAAISNTEQYNDFGGADLASVISGFYVEAGYNILQSLNIEDELVSFVRYENYNTHAKVNANMTANDSFHREEIIAGLGWKMAKGAVLKADYQLTRTKADTDWKSQINLGIGVMF